MDNVTHKFLSMYLILFITLYMFRARCARNMYRVINKNKYIEGICVSRGSFTKNHYMMHGQQNVQFLLVAAPAVYLKFAMYSKYLLNKSRKLIFPAFVEEKWTYTQQFSFISYYTNAILLCYQNFCFNAVKFRITVFLMFSTFSPQTLTPHSTKSWLCLT